MSVNLMLGDCLEWLPSVPDASVDCVITDPPYPEISRPYGRLTEAEWWALIVEGVIPHVRRILKPTGSAVFILQPNSRKVGSMRGWLWEFMAWACREWNMVQDAWWWNTCAVPTTHCQERNGLMRPSLKACVWLGPDGCYRDQSSVLDTTEKAWMKRRWDQTQSDSRRSSPGGNSMNGAAVITTASDRGGSTPFNVLPMGNGSRHDMAGMHGHGAGTPINIADWWVRYISPPFGLVCDPFMGSGTMGLAALARGRSFVGVEKMPEYFAIAERRINAARSALPLFADAAGEVA